MSSTSKGLAVLAAFALSAVFASTVSAKPSGPGPGNSPNAKACQKGGWANLVRGEDDSSFASQDECVSHAAQGGALAHPRLTSQQVCEDAGGTFEEGGTNPDFGNPLLWTCRDFELDARVSAACFSDGGSSISGGAAAPGRFTGHCNV